MKSLSLSLFLLLSAASFAQTSFTNGNSAACVVQTLPTYSSYYCSAAPMYDAVGNYLGNLTMYAIVSTSGKLMAGSTISAAGPTEAFSGQMVGNVFSGTFPDGVITSEVLGTKRLCTRSSCRTVTILTGGSGTKN